MGETVLWRVYCDLRLNLPQRGKKRLPTSIKQSRQTAGQLNQIWSSDLMSDALGSSHRLHFCSAITNLIESA